jgi:cell division protein FtsZ
LGAGARPEVGRRAAEESIEEIRNILEKNTQMLFITAGMGGGTGTGAAPVIASIARELDILTVGIVTLPFSFEGRKRRQQAELGIDELRKYVDTLLIINNDRLREFGNLKLTEAFQRADNILSTAAKGIAEIITVKGYINVDFEDVKTVMRNSGKAIMGSGLADGPDRAIKAAKQAISSPLLNDNDINGAKNMLLYIASGIEGEISMDEVTEITDFIKQSAGQDVDVIWGTGFDETLGESLSITLIATGFESKPEPVEETVRKNVIPLNQEIAAVVQPQPPTPEMVVAQSVELLSKPLPLEVAQASIYHAEPAPVQEVTFAQPAKTATQLNIEITEPTLISRPVATQVAEPASELLAPATPKQGHQLLQRVGIQSRPDEHDQERRRKLSSYSVIGKSESELLNLEEVPAYKRKGMALNQTPSPEVSSAAKWEISNDNDMTEAAYTRNKKVD